MADNNFLFTHIFYYLPANLGKKQKDDRSLLTNNYFCTLKYKIMKGILPVYCRTMGYVVLLLSVFVPLLMFMFGMINDSNLLFTKASIKLLIWFSLFMIFLAKVKDENEKISRIRVKAICYAIYLLGIYYIVMLVRGVYNGNLEEADNSIAIVYMAFNVICLEFGVQKSRVDRLFKK